MSQPQDDTNLSANDQLSSPGEIPDSPLSEIDRDDLNWLKNVYRGDKMPQFTLRTIIMGMMVGGVMSLSNLYVGLKMGWGFGVTVTSCVIAFAAFKMLEKIIPAIRRKPFNILEDCTMTTCASAAGSLSTGALISAVPALYLVTGQPMIWWQMMIWVGCIALLGVCMAIPLKRQMINIDKLPFPSGTATAGTLRTLHTTGGDAVAQAKALFGCGLFAALLNFWVDAWRPLCLWFGNLIGNVGLGEKLGWAFPGKIPLFPGKFGKMLMDERTMFHESSALFLAAGALMGIRVGTSLLIGAVIYFGTLPYYIFSEKGFGIVWDPAKIPFVNISGGWTLWPAVAMMVTAGLTTFVLRWKTIAKSFSELTAIFGVQKKQSDPLAEVEAPMWWFLVGVLVSGAACVYFGHLFFSIRWWMGVIAVALTFLLAIIAARATGETDFTPIGAMGKITQLTYGVLAPSNTTINLATASITGAGACHSADLLVSLKAGYLVGANPRRQVLSQLFGVMAGILICVPVYLIIVRAPEFEPNVEEPATNLCTDEFPAPSVTIWKSVAVLLAEGFSKLPNYSVVAMCITGALGIALALADEFLPKHYAKWLPSATGLGIAGVVQAQQSIAMFIGALVAWLWMKNYPKSGEKFIVAGSSGLIAGESLMGVTIKLWEGGPVIFKGIWHSLFG
ncbi:MAG: OPT/YSL family transporter [Pirellulales bacterium]|nr:OPT/YSL family transporter [Pirellulales bacterium]